MPADNWAPTQNERVRSHLLWREKRLRGKSNTELGLDVGVSQATISKGIGAKERISDDSWLLISHGLGWGDFLAYVADGDLEAMEACESVPEETRRYAGQQLRRASETG